MGVDVDVPTDIVDVPEPLTEAGVKLAVAPEGRPVTDIVSVLLKPFSAVTVAVTVDASGNVFVGATANNTVKEILAAGSYTTVNTLGSGFSSPEGVAVDAGGNVFIADSGNNAVKEILAAGGYTTVNTLGSGFNSPEGVAVDGSGNVFVADSRNNAVKEIPSGCASASCVQTLASGFSSPEGVAVDGSGNVFVADSGNNAVKEILATGGYTAVSTLASGFSSPDGVAVDGSGNVFVSDNANNRVVKLDYADAPALTFATATPVGSTDMTDGPQTVTIQNIGNATLNLSGITMTSTDFSTDGSTTTCSTSSPIAAESSCVVGALFSPTTTGSIPGTLTLTDNALNVPGATQQVQLSGTGLDQQSQTITFPNPGPQTYGVAPLTLTATASSGLAVSYAVTSGPATVSGSTLTITGAGTVKVTASQAGNANYGAATPVSQSFTVNPDALTVTANNASRLYGAPNPAFTYTITGYVNGDTSAVVSGTPSLATTETTASPVGTYPITFSTESLAASNYSFKYIAGTLTVSAATAATPVFKPAAGTYKTTQSVTITDATAGATIYYTTNGKTPTTASTKYIGAMKVTATKTIKAIAVATGYTQSAVATAAYTIR